MLLTSNCYSIRTKGDRVPKHFRIVPFAPSHTVEPLARPLSGPGRVCFLFVFPCHQGSTAKQWGILSKIVGLTTQLGILIDTLRR